jgi:hypothetical protein
MTAYDWLLVGIIGVVLAVPAGVAAGWAAAPFAFKAGAVLALAWLSAREL